MREEVTCDHFLDALGDSDLVLKIRERRPADLDSALRFALQFEKSSSSNYYISRCLTSGKTELAVEALRREMKEMKKLMEFGHRASWDPNGGHRQPAATRYTAPSAYSLVPSASLSSRGLHPASHGNRLGLARPSNGYRINRSGNFCRVPNPNFRCFNCGNPTHRARECPILSAELQRPEQQSMSPLIRQPPDVRPIKNRSDKRDKTCIRVKYRQYELSALIDTGSDVSIAGEDRPRPRLDDSRTPYYGGKHCQQQDNDNPRSRTRGVA